MKPKERLSLPGILTLVAPVALIGFFSTSPAYRYHAEDQAQLTVSFKMHTERERLCDEKELEQFKEAAEHRRKHMQRASRVCGSRERVPLHLKVLIDGSAALDEKIAPSGLRSDGPTFVYAKFLLAAGAHRIKVMGRDYRSEEGAYPYVFDEKISFGRREIVVIDFSQENKKLQIHASGGAIRRTYRN